MRRQVTRTSSENVQNRRWLATIAERRLLRRFTSCTTHVPRVEAITRGCRGLCRHPRLRRRRHRWRAALDLGECVVTNPPFSELPRVLARLRELGKPFVVIMPCSTLTTCYFRDLFQDIQVIVPRRRIQFRKLVDGVEVPSGRCSFDCLYFCWRLGLPRDVVFLG